MLRVAAQRSAQPQPSLRFPAEDRFYFKHEVVAEAAKKAAARAALVEQLTELQGSHEALHQEMEALGSQLQLLRGNPQALAALAMSDLQSLEAELEHTCRCVRATLLQRSTDEAALRASHEKEVKAMVFNCGHQSCSACAAKLQACPFCRVKITAKIKLFA
ncbi:hypothetical protein V8C86DRAFT_3094486 [Haematococcus lacustris]